MKGILTFLLVMFCSACATIKTLDPPKNHVTIAHHGKKSYCSEIPRIYSGIAYNLCLFYGEPSKTKNLGDSLNGVPLVFFDSVFSVVSDTVVLPYTITMQSKKGPIKVN